MAEPMLSLEWSELGPIRHSSDQAANPLSDFVRPPCRRLASQGGATR